MILSFKTHWKDGSPTKFVPKIWASLFQETKLTTSEFYFDYTEYLMNYSDKKFSKSEEIFPIFCEEKFSKDGLITPKLHTIRKGNRWKAGMKIHFAINNRSKDYFQFAPVVTVKSVQKIVINHFADECYQIIIDDDNQLFFTEKKQLSINDGFESLEDFYNFFVPNPNDRFEGQIIHWTDTKY